MHLGVCAANAPQNQLRRRKNKKLVIRKIKNRTRGVHIYDIYLLYIFDMKGKNNNNTKVIK